MGRPSNKREMSFLSGLFVDTASIIAGGLIGLLLKKGISKKISDAVMIGIGLCVVFIGITGLDAEVGIIALLLSLVIGAVIGTAVDIDARLNALGARLEKRLIKSEENRFAKGFVTFTLLSCTGAYTIMASLNAGLGDSSMLYTKAIIDFVVSIMLGSTLGIGVAFSSIAAFCYQGILMLFSGALAPILSEAMLSGISCVGALLTIPIGTNMMGLSDIKIANYIPAIIAAPFIVWITSMIPAL